MKYLFLAAIATIVSICPAAAWDGTGWGTGKDKTYVDPGTIRAGQNAEVDALRAKEMEDGRRGWVERTYHCLEVAGTCPAPGSSPRSDIEPVQRFAQVLDPCQGACPGCGGIKCGNEAQRRGDYPPSESGIVRNSVFTQELADQCSSGEYNCRTWVAEPVKDAPRRAEAGNTFHGRTDVCPGGSVVVGRVIERDWLCAWPEQLFSPWEHRKRAKP